MIVVITSPIDATGMAVHAELKSRQVDVVHLVEAALFPGLQSSLTVPESPSEIVRLTLSRGDSPATVRGAFAQITGRAFEGRRTIDQEFMNAEWNATVQAWLESIQGNVINRLPPKLWYQRRIGVAVAQSLLGDLFRFPRFLISSCPADGLALFDECVDGVTYSPQTSAQRYSFSNRAALERALRSALHFPFYLCESFAQQRVDAIVVGDRTFCANSTIAKEEEKCAAAARRLGAAFCRFVFVETEDRGPICLGVDLQPDISRYPSPFGSQVIAALADALTS